MKIPFAISARTAHLIGMENFANAEGAIIELVKNAYDADADTCVVVADIREDNVKSKLFIIDNGSGMTDEIIIKHWMARMISFSMPVLQIKSVLKVGQKVLVDLL